MATGDEIYKGVNFSGAEYAGCDKHDMVYGKNYTYPSTALMDGFVAVGMNTFRIPFCWERVQPQAMGPLNSAELDRLDKTVQYLIAKNATVVLDVHNYAAYWGVRIGSGTTKEMLADLWSKLATHYKSNSHVLFGLMNEPNGLSGETWLDAANATIAAIRKTGANNLILVPGVAWTGAHSWTATSYGTPNAVTMLNVGDPANNYAYDAHQYFDKDSSGTTTECVSATIGADRLAAISSWLRANKKRAFLGEFGVANSVLCLSALQQLMEFLSKNTDIWIGWTYWSAGDWQPKYMFNLVSTIDPSNPNQMQVLKPFLTGTVSCNATKSNCIPSPPVIKQITPE